ncbi:MAG: hypothetical protein M3R47_21300, partial [Chloroflexota bacterium]|nr:hypothetical protein [Chloroflexota bacterium]
MFKEFFTQRLKRGLVRRLNNLKIARMARLVARQAPQPTGAPVAFFKASTGIDDLSWNSGFHLLASWAFRLRGIPVVYFACEAGMSHCVLGTNRENVRKAPPCKSCVSQSRTLYAGVPSKVESQRSGVAWFNFKRDNELERALENLSVEQLSKFEWKIKNNHVIASAGRVGGDLPPYRDQAKQSARDEDEIASSQNALLAMTLPLGALCLPGLRWILRVHNLNDDESTRYLLRDYILSAWNVAQKFSKFLNETGPRAVIVFNGQFFPEATARYIAQERGIRVITHEVGLQPASAFFTDGEATAYPIAIPESFELNAEQNAKLDAYLAKRFQGDFSMAGIKFWAEMKGLDEAFLAKAANFKQIVPVFTNVIFDTSQPHANTVFEDMFDWLDMTLDVIRAHPETLFVIRAHPDETRTRKESHETVKGWVEGNDVDKLENVVFVAPRETLSSYELIQKSKFVIVYNSTIGLEASLMGKPVLCAGKARFTQYPIVFFPQTVDE